MTKTTKIALLASAAITLSLGFVVEGRAGLLDSIICNQKHTYAEKAKCFAQWHAAQDALMGVSDGMTAYGQQQQNFANSIHPYVPPQQGLPSGTIIGVTPYGFVPGTVKRNWYRVQ